MLAATKAFPKYTFPYDATLGPNSNSAAHYLSVVGGLSVPDWVSVKYNFPGWKTELLVP